MLWPPQVATSTTITITSNPKQDKQVQQGARTPSSASLFMTDSAVGAGKKIGGKKQDHSPAFILLPMIHPLRSATLLNSKAG
jgi:hypothetical protein